MTDTVALDYDSLRQKGIAVVQNAIPDLDTSLGSPDVAVVEASATIGSKIAYYANRLIGSERWLKTAQLRTSVQELLRLIGYELKGATPAVSTITFTLARTYPDSLTIPAATQIQTDDGSITYETDQPTVIVAGTLTGSVSVTEGQTIVEQYRGVSAVDAPEGQSIPLAQGPFINDDSEEVLVSGVTWTRVDSFLESTSTSQHYLVEVNASTNRATVRFGDGITGIRPPDGSIITVRYRIGGGKRGRVKRNRLKRIVGSFRTDGGTPVEITATNPTDSNGGNDRETIDHAKLAGPASLRGTSRSIANEDFVLHALEVPGVARAFCHTHNEDPTIPWLDVRLYIVPTGGGVASQALLDAVFNHIINDKPKADIMGLHVVSANYSTVAVAVAVHCFKGRNTSAIQAAAETVITALFDPEAREPKDPNQQSGESTPPYVLDFGQPVWRSKITAAVQRLAGVRSVVMTLPENDNPPSNYEFPTLAGLPTVTVIEDPT